MIWNSCNENMQHAETKKYTWNILYKLVTCLCMESVKLTVDYLAAFPYSIVNDSPSLYLVRLKVAHCFTFAAFSHLITRSREHLIACACRNMISTNHRTICYYAIKKKVAMVARAARGAMFPVIFITPLPTAFATLSLHLINR